MRKEIYDQKRTFFNASFLQVLYDVVQKKYKKEYAIASKTTELRQKEKTPLEIPTDVLKRIQEYPDFCKSCKPPKKKS